MPQAIEDSGAGVRPGRLYVTDGSLPSYDEADYPNGAPGMPCSIDAATNTMLPRAVRSNRGTNVFHLMKARGAMLCHAVRCFAMLCHAVRSNQCLPPHEGEGGARAAPMHSLCFVFRVVGGACKSQAGFF
jgi:hypothetical protein